MAKIIAGINMTLDGVCDHTAVDPDEEIHDHYSDLLKSADVALYGRITYQLMEFWRTIIENPSEEQSMNDFAEAIDNLPKIVFSHTLKSVDWHSAKLATRSLEEVVLDLKNNSEGVVLVGCRSLIIQLMKLNLIDEYQLCVHPVIVGSGLPLFEDVHDKTKLKLSNTKVFGSGAVMLYYEPIE